MCGGGGWGNISTIFPEDWTAPPRGWSRDPTLLIAPEAPGGRYMWCCQMLDKPSLGLVLIKSQQGRTARNSQAWKRQPQTVDCLWPQTECLKLDKDTSWHQGWILKEKTVGKQTLDSAEMNSTSFFALFFLLHSYLTLFLCLWFCSLF